VAGETKEKERARATTAVALALDIVEKLRVVAARRNIAQADILDPLVRPWVMKEYAKELAEMRREQAGEAGA
jgi:hypothetical protein